MFNFFTRGSANSSDLLTSGLFDQSNFYSSFVKDLSNAVSEVIIESPFISAKRINALYPSFRVAAKRGVHIVINTKHPSELDDQNAYYALQAIERLQAIGVTVLYTGGHHRKLAVVDRTVLWEGSLNILSQNDSCEIMRRIASAVLADQMIKFTGIDRFL